MGFTLVILAGTCTDAAWRLETSGTSLLSRMSHTGQSVTVSSGLSMVVWMFLVMDGAGPAMSVPAYSPGFRSRRAQTTRLPPAAVLADRLRQVCLERGEPVAFGGWQVGSSGQQVDQGLRLLELRWGVQPD